MKIRKTSEKVQVKIGEIVFSISPLNFDQKCDIQNVLAGGGAMSIIKACKLAVKYSVKHVQGLENSDGSKYSLSFDEQGVSDECIDDLSNTEMNDSLSFLCFSLLNGLPKNFENPITKEPLEGVSYVKQEDSDEKK